MEQAPRRARCPCLRSMNACRRSERARERADADANRLVNAKRQEAASGGGGQAGPAGRPVGGRVSDIVHCLVTHDGDGRTGSLWGLRERFSHSPRGARLTLRANQRTGPSKVCKRNFGFGTLLAKLRHGRHHARRRPAGSGGGGHAFIRIF